MYNKNHPPPLSQIDKSKIKFEKGKKVAEQIKRENERKREAAEQAAEGKTSGKTVDKLKELAELRREGLISEEEFTAMKKKLIGE